MTYNFKKRRYPLTFHWTEETPLCICINDLPNIVLYIIDRTINFKIVKLKFQRCAPRGGITGGSEKV